MVIGLGLDIIEIARLRGVLDRHGERFADRVFTAGEQEIAAGRPRTKEEFFAGRWAAKEAVAKALGCGFGTDCGWQDIEIINDNRGKPEVSLHGRARQTADARGIKRLLVSISHEMHYATAVAVAEE